MATCNLEYDKIQTLTVPLPTVTDGSGFEVLGGNVGSSGATAASSGLFVDLDNVGVIADEKSYRDTTAGNIRFHPLQSSPYNQPSSQYRNGGRGISASDDKDLFEWGDSSSFSLASSAEMCRINETLFEAMRSG